jgi:hypothetical protein
MVNEAFAFTAMFGSACIGFVWGWLMGNLGGRIQRLILDCSALGFSTIILAIVILLLNDLFTMTIFLVASALALFLHIEWRYKLSNHSGPPIC